MKGLLKLSVVVAGLVVFTAGAQAAVLFDTTYGWSATGTEADQTNRLFRDSVQSVWGAVKPTPAVVASGPEDYIAFNQNSSVYTQIQVTIQQISNHNVYSAAYSAYTPASPDSGYLADAGVSSGTSPPVNYIYQFDIASFTNFTVVLSTADGAGTALNGSTRLLIEGFTAVPEPASMLTMGIGLLGLGFFAKRRLRRS